MSQHASRRPLPAPRRESAGGHGRMLKMLGALLSLWAWLAVAGMGYFACHWFPRAQDAGSNEMAIGFMLGLFYGWPSWLGLPVLAAVGRTVFQRWQIVVMLAPLVVAALLYGAGSWLSAAASHRHLDTHAVLRESAGR